MTGASRFFLPATHSFPRLSVTYLTFSVEQNKRNHFNNHAIIYKGITYIVKAIDLANRFSYSHPIQTMKQAQRECPVATFRQPGDNGRG